MTTIAQRILRIVQPGTESQRRDFRMTLACASAHAEELNRGVCTLLDTLRDRPDRGGKQLPPGRGAKPT